MLHQPWLSTKCRGNDSRITPNSMLKTKLFKLGGSTISEIAPFDLAFSPLILQLLTAWLIKDCPPLTGQLLDASIISGDFNPMTREDLIDVSTIAMGADTWGGARLAVDKFYLVGSTFTCFGPTVTALTYEGKFSMSAVGEGGQAPVAHGETLTKHLTPTIISAESKNTSLSSPHILITHSRTLDHAQPSPSAPSRPREPQPIPSHTQQRRKRNGLLPLHSLFQTP
ncbi:MAG: hypothetical protein Q9222_003066 [Ikaeria aurantiellina]